MSNPDPVPAPATSVPESGYPDLGAVSIQAVYRVVAQSFAPDWYPASPAVAYLAVVGTASGRMFANVALARDPAGGFQAWLNPARKFADKALAEAIATAFEQHLRTPCGAGLIVQHGAGHD